MDNQIDDAEGAEAMYKRILAAIDWTAGADAVVDQARQLAALTGAAVHGLHVQPMNVPSPPTLSTLANQALTTGPAPGDAAAAAHRMVDEAVAVLDAAGVHAEGTVLETPGRYTAGCAAIGPRRARRLDRARCPAARLAVGGVPVQRRRRGLSPRRMPDPDRALSREGAALASIPGQIIARAAGTGSRR